jgi:hypothetical protein
MEVVSLRPELPEFAKENERPSFFLRKREGATAALFNRRLGACDSFPRRRKNVGYEHQRCI